MYRLTSMLIAGAIASGSAAASPPDVYPLELTYSVSPLASGRYHYDFTLTLTNADGSWRPGHAWDAFVFGDVPRFQISPLVDIINCEVLLTRERLA